MVMGEHTTLHVQYPNTIYVTPHNRTNVGFFAIKQRVRCIEALLREAKRAIEVRFLRRTDLLMAARRAKLKFSNHFGDQLSRRFQPIYPMPSVIT